MKIMKWHSEPSYVPRFFILNGAKNLFYCLCEEERRINLLSIVFILPLMYHEEPERNGGEEHLVSGH